MFSVSFFHEYTSLNQKPRFRGHRVMLPNALIASLIQFALYQMQITVFATDKDPPITKLPSCFTVGGIEGAVTLLPTLRCKYTFPFDRKISNFESPIQKALFYCSIVQYLVHWTCLILFCFLHSGFFLIVQLHKVFSSQWMMTHCFHEISSVMFVEVCLLSRKLVTLMKLTSG